MLAADLEATALKIGYAKQEFHGTMNSRKRGLGITSVKATISLDFLFFPRHICLQHSCNVSIFRERNVSNYKCAVYRLDIIIFARKKFRTIYR